MAKQEQRPAYMVLSNKALIHMARVRPHSMENLLEMHGIGPAKVEKYGSDLLRILSEFEAKEDESAKPDIREEEIPF
jgi:superfamily II DNA helicase RecQ